MHVLAPVIRRAACLGVASTLWACSNFGTEPDATLGADASACQSSCDASRRDAAAADAGGRDAAGGPDKADAGGGDAGGAGKADAAGDAAMGDSGQFVLENGCVATSSKAEKQALDMYIMLDHSGSMDDPLAGGNSKWKAVTDALLSFLAQPAMDGISVGLQYFPLAANQQCPLAQLCSQDSDCTCGPCIDLILFKVCAGSADSCEAKDYATTEVEIAPIASSEPSIRASIARQTNGGGTPTSAALQGAIDHARAWASDPKHANHVTIVVLATDGIPTECDADLGAIDAIAAGGASASPSVRTFVIGVGDSLDSLNGIAQSGGTGSAVIVDTSADVNAQFLEALNRIRGAAVACTYSIPEPPNGRQLDYDQVNVVYTPGGSASWKVLGQVQDAAACAGKSNAWHYDNPGQPHQILLCPDTCSAVESDATGKIDVLLGCETTGPN